jgi:hypothetical protein
VDGNIPSGCLFFLRLSSSIVALVGYEKRKENTRATIKALVTFGVD